MCGHYIRSPLDNNNCMNQYIKTYFVSSFIINFQINQNILQWVRSNFVKPYSNTYQNNIIKKTQSSTKLQITHERTIWLVWKFNRRLWCKEVPATFLIKNENNVQFNIENTSGIAWSHPRNEAQHFGASHTSVVLAKNAKAGFCCQGHKCPKWPFLNISQE